jgi:putative ABC transport system permease protein
MMRPGVVEIELGRLAWMVVPALGVVWLLTRRGMEGRGLLYALGRMLLQLLLIGYVLIAIFRAESPWVVLGVLGVMLGFSSWIALRTVPEERLRLLGLVLGAIALGGGSVLALVTQGVLGLDPWYRPDYMIPLAGMVFANAMNGVALAAERYHAEIQRDVPPSVASTEAVRAAMIPVVNALLAVGLVSLPGMMTGQILSGVSPLVAARYQILVMVMIFTSSGLSVTLFLHFLRKKVDHR